MPKLEYTSESDNEEPGENEVTVTLPALLKDDKPKEKLKKPRTQAQEDATNKMREALKIRKANDKQLKKELADKMMDDTLSHKLIKKEINKKVNLKLKQIVDTNNDDISDSDEEVIIIPKRKPRAKSLPTVEKPVNEIPIKKPVLQPVLQQKALIRFV